MPEEVVTPETPVVETAPAATTPEPAKAEEKKEPVDWEAAYKGGSQFKLNKLHERTEDLIAQNRVLAEAVETLKKSQSAVLRHTVGEDEAKRIEAEQAIAQERAAALEAARHSGAFIKAQTDALFDLLEAAGVDPKDPELDWGKDASNVQEWKERVVTSVKEKLTKVNEDRARQVESKIKAKSAQEIKEEAEAQTQRQLKAAEVDKVDLARGGPTPTLGQRMADMDPTSPEFARLMQQAKAGKLRI